MILKDFRPGTILKLHDGETPTGLYGYVMRQMKVETNDSEMAATFTCSTPAVDRRRDVVKTHGIDLADHRLNPISLLGHNMEWIVGATEDRAGKYTAWITGEPRFKAKIFYDQGTELGQQTYIAVKEKRLRGASIGFIPKPGRITKSVGPDGHPIQVYEACRLVEISTVPIPDNQECILEMVHKGLGGAKLCDPLMTFLKPYCPERKAAVSGGWETPVSVKKAYPDEDTLNGGGGADPMAADPSAPPPDDPMAPDADPNAAPANPHAEHDETIHDGTEQQLYALWCKYRGQGLSVADTLDKMKVALEANEQLVGPGGDDDLGEDDEDDESDDDETTKDTPPDLNDDDKERAEKMVRVVWTKGYAGPIGRVAEDIAHVLSYDNLDPRKAQAFLRKTLARMEALPEIDGVIEKALKANVVKAAAETPMDDLDDAVLAEAAEVMRLAREAKAEIFG